MTHPRWLDKHERQERTAPAHLRVGLTRVGILQVTPLDTGGVALVAGYPSWFNDLWNEIGGVAWTLSPHGIADLAAMITARLQYTFGPMVHCEPAETEMPTA
jgi:hypothetical protein